MKRSGITLAGCIAALVAPAVASAATSAPYTSAPPLTTAEILVAGGPGNQTDPHVDGALVSYTDETTPITSRIGYIDLTTGVAGTIPQAGEYDFLSDVSASGVTFTRFTAAGSAIWVYDVAGGVGNEVSPLPGSARADSAIGGSTIAWVDQGLHPDPAATEMVVYDLGTQAQARLTDDARSDTSPDIDDDGRTLVWTSCTVNLVDCNVVRAVRGASGWNVAVVTGAPGEEGVAATDGELIAYDSNAAGTRDVVWQPVGGGGELSLGLPAIQQNASVDGGLVVFESNDGGDFDILAFDTRTGLLYRVSSTPQNDTLSAIDVDGNRATVVFARSNGVDSDLYARSFALHRAETYADPDDFEADAGPLEWVDFEGDACGDPLATPVSAGSTYAPLGLTFTSGGSLGRIRADAAASSGENVLEGVLTLSMGDARVDGSLAAGVTAFGFTAVGGAVKLRAYDAAGRLIAVATTDADPSTKDFLGVRSSVGPIATFSLTGAPHVLVDDVRFTKTANLDCDPPTVRIVLPPQPVRATSSTGAVVTYAVTAADDADPSPSLTCSPPSGTVFPVGVTTIACTATDASGKTSTVLEVVTVVSGPAALAHQLACGALRYFIDWVEARRGTTIPVERADRVIAAAERARTRLGCP